MIIYVNSVPVHEIKALKWSYLNGLGETHRPAAYEWFSCILNSFLFSFIFHKTTTLVEINCANLAQVHTHQGSLRPLTKAFFNEFVYASSASSGWDRVCMCDELQCVKEPGFISSCNTLMTLLFHSYPVSRSYYHINTCVIKAPQTISWII